MEQESKKHYCQICDSSYIETTQKKAEYVCTMCREYEEKENPKRILPKDELINFDLVTDSGND